MHDYDGPKNGRPAVEPPTLFEVLAVARVAFGGRNWPVALSLERSPSGKGFHMVIYWQQPMEPLLIVALQLALRSDVRRETMNLGRVLSSYGADGAKRWNILYDAKL